MNLEISNDLIDTTIISITPVLFYLMTTKPLNIKLASSILFSPLLNSVTVEQSPTCIFFFSSMPFRLAISVWGSGSSYVSC